MPPRPSGATMRKRPAKTVPGAKRPQSAPLAVSVPAEVASPGRRVRSSIRALSLVRLRVVDRELLQSRAGQAESGRFGVRAVRVPVIDCEALDHPHGAT